MRVEMKLKRILLIMVVLVFTIPSKSLASEEIIESAEEMLDISSFISEAQKYTEDVFNDINFSDILNSAITGDIDETSVAKKIVNLLGIEMRKQITMVGSIIIIIVIHSILKSVSDGLDNGGISQITYLVQYILIVTLIMTNFAGIISSIKDTIQNLVGFSYSLIPLLLALMMITGSLVTASTVQSILLIMITFIGSFISTFLLPMVLIGTSLGIISKISDKVQIDKIAKTFKSSVVWILGIALTIFTSVLSLESSLAGHVDKITTKTTKAVVSNAIPVVGKILSDTTEMVLGSGIVLKNAVGIIGVIVIIGICAMPIIRLAVLTVLYHILSAVCQPIADKKIVDIIEQMRDTFKVLLAMVCSISVMLIIGLTIVIKISTI
ncbi:MAG: hypothetical protein HFJ19_00895 [Clostridia bacterium]|nr:hypothetical protein [Clostridia bacterium]